MHRVWRLLTIGLGWKFSYLFIIINFNYFYNLNVVFFKFNTIVFLSCSYMDVSP